jgi:CheY-like chemotaxis protein
MEVESGELQEIEQKLCEIQRVSRMGAETVRRLNRFCRRGEPGAQEEMATFDLSDAVRQVVDMSMPLWKEEPKKRGLTLSLDCRLGEGCTIRGAKSDIFDVILNLVKNAVEALPEGGGIEIDTVREGEEVILRVRDTGIGIPAANINRLFTPFFTTSVVAGRGLGLSTCRTIIDSHGGHILVQSTQGAGTTFTVKLPFADPQEHTATQRAPVTPLKPLRILVIDDMEGTVTLLKRALERMGHAVLTALSGEEGLRLLEDTPVDLVICDLGMPGMNGRQVGEAIAQRCSQQGLRRPRFIVLTGWGGQALETEQTAASEVDAVIEKPVDTAKLVEVISRLVGAESEKT